MSQKAANGMTDERGQLLETIESLKAIHELSEQLAHNHLSLEQVSEKIHQSTPLFSSFAIEDALSAADQALWSAPCTSWCLAQAAH